MNPRRVLTRPGGGCLELGPVPAVMGVLNCTPDSFHAGSRHLDRDAAVQAGLAMLEEGATILDIGGESTRPGADPVSLDEECRRVLPVIQGLRDRTDAFLSVDTRTYEVAKAALEAGADMINDINAFRGDARFPALIADHGAAAVLMHMQGSPRDMQDAPTYTDVVKEVTAFLHTRAEVLIKAGVPSSSILLDPGFGFGKTHEQNRELFQALASLAEGPHAVLVGVSRKSMIGHATGAAVEDRMAPSVALAVLAAQAGASILRVHDVAQTVLALRMQFWIESPLGEMA